MPDLTGLPDDVTQVGAITISVFMGPDGLGHAYGLDGVTTEAAIGYLTVVTDRLRDERRMEWMGGGLDLEDLECPNCGESFVDSDDDDDEDDDDR